MLRRSVLLVMLGGVLICGCASLQPPFQPAVVPAAGSRRPSGKDRSARSAARSGDVARPASRTSGAGVVAPAPAVATVGEDGWLAGLRRRMAQASRDITADLDFHETEGLEAFAPDAREQVDTLRRDMHGSAAITR